MNGAHLLLLMSLASSDKHGHALMKDVERFSGVHLGPGTLYQALARLEELGLIQALDPVDRRRPYALSEEGRFTLARSVEHLERVVDEGRRVLRRVRPRPRVAPAR